MSNTSLLDTNLNQIPYVDDFDPAKAYYRVLFKPSTPVQTRELNVLQDMLYHQIYRFGQNIFVSGTIIDGCNITTQSYLDYVKVNDTYANSAALNVRDLVGNQVTSNSGLKALVLNSLPGYQATAPNLNTLYISYLNSAVNSTTNAAIKVFQNDEVLNIVNPSNVTIGQVTVANTTSSGASNTTGYGYAVSVDNGVIFQKGMFLEVQSQTLVVSPYTNTPNNLSVGFSSVESIITAFEDTSLFDNSQGVPNQSGPGADRLKIVPTLVAITTSQAGALGNNFFSIIDFVGGAPSIVNQSTTYSVIGDKMAQISDDTNGSFVIDPFNVRLKKLYAANGAVDANNMRLEIDGGLGYINGRRLDISGQVLGILRKGTDVAQANTQVISAQYGNYVVLQEVAGLFDPTAVQTVSLRDTAAYGISNNLAKGVVPNSLSAPGNELGKASLYAFQYSSGTESTSNAQYFAYLFNVNMTNGSFTNVRSIYANSAGLIGVGDIVLTNNTAIVQASNFKSKIFPFYQGAIGTLKTASNTVDTQFEFTAKSSVTFAATGNVSITVPSYTGGTNQWPYGTGLLNALGINQNILVIAEANVHSTNIAGALTVSSSSNAVAGLSTVFQTALYAGAYLTLANSSASETKQVAAITSNTALTTNIPFTSAWTSANAYITYFAGEPIPLAVANAAVNVINSTAMTITLPSAVSGTFNAQVFYNVLRTAAVPAKKAYQTTVYAKIDCSNNAGNTVGPWCLGVPDVVSVSNVWVGTTYSNTNPSLTSSFVLQNGQTDSTYSLSYLKNVSAALTGSNKILVEYQCFVPDVSSGAGFFSVDSYPIDDTGVTPNTIFTYNIPYYYSASDQETYNLRNSLDFRIYQTNTIPLVGNLSLAISNTLIINPNTNTTFMSSIFYSPVPDSLVESSYKYYLGRYDTIGLSNAGTIITNAGVPAENPIPGGDVTGGMTLARIFIPPYPSLTNDVANTTVNPYLQTVNIDYRTNRRYTMRDIGVLDQRLKTVEYYTSLSVLEQSAQNLLLTNQSGANRFQNGILVDPMNDFSIANTLDPSFNIAIDSELSVARPIFSQLPIQLKHVHVANDGVNFANGEQEIVLSYSQVTTPFVSQPFASQERNCSQDTMFVWTGVVTLNPTGDWISDTTIAPSVVSKSTSTSNFTNLTGAGPTGSPAGGSRAWGTSYGVWNEVSNNTPSLTTGAGGPGGTSRTSAGKGTSTGPGATSSGTSTSMGTSSSAVGRAITPTTSSGSNSSLVVTSVSLQPFCSAKSIQFSATGLKPNTQFWIFFNDTNVTTNCAPTNSSFVVQAGNTFTSDALGNLYGIFYLPAGTFYASTITFAVMDISNLVTQNNVTTSIATTLYYGTNLAYTQSTLPKPPAQVITITTINNSNNTGYVSQHGGTGPGGGGTDPIAQSFNIPDTMVPNGVEGVYTTSFDIFFAAKDPTLGITFQIQPVANGSIVDEVVPYSQIHLTPAQINTSSTSAVATNIQFPAPVLLEAGSDYAFVLKPDGNNPNYDVWTGVISATDVVSGSPIYGFSTSGVMFLSSQGSTWTPYQSENIKFNMYIANFTSTSGVASLVNDDSEYLNVNSSVSSFTLGEKVYFGNTVIGAANVSVNTTSSTFTVASTSGMANGNLVGIISQTNQKAVIATVNTVVNTTVFTLTANGPYVDASATVVLASGTTGYVGSSNSSFMRVANSSANSTVYLTANVGYVMGSTSGAFANALLTDIAYDVFMPKLSVYIPTVCAMSYSMKGTSNSTTGYVADTNPTNLTYGRSVELLDQERVVMSKSNEQHSLSGNKSLTVNANMSTVSSYLSPAINTVKLGALTVYNVINNDDANGTVQITEIGNFGNAINKYISTTVTLAPGLDAEDLTLYLGAYWPSGTILGVYAKIQNQYDSDNFNNKSWTPLVTNNTVRSSMINTQDYNEYVYSFPNTAFANTTAYHNASNNQVVTYTTSNGAVFGTFNTFAVKVVFLSNTSQIVPQVTDFRVLCSTSNV